MQKRLTETLLLALLGFFGRAEAQTQNNEIPSAAIVETPQQVVISAQKREEKLQSSALSVTALSVLQLQMAGVQSVADLARLSPGLNVVSSGPGQNILIMRGISSTAGSAGTVGYYLDNTPIAASSNASLLSLRGVLDPALLDIARVEVLRGPQGSLYGSSSMGGTVRYLSNSPDPRRASWDYQQQLSHTEGGGWNTQVSGVANFPLLENRLALRLGAFYRWQDGYIQRYPVDAQNYLRLPAAQPESRVNTEKTTGLKAHLKWWLADDWTLSASALQQRTSLGAPFQVDMPPGGIQNLWQTRLVAEPSTQVSTLVNLEIRKQFEHAELISSSSFYYRDVQLDEDASKVIYTFFSPPQTRIYPVVMQGRYSNREFTQELRLGTDLPGPWQVVAGAWYHHVNAPLASQIPVTAGYNQSFGTQYQSFFTGSRMATSAEIALFGELSYQFAPAWTARLGLRSFRIHQSFVQNVDGEFVGGKPSGVSSDAADRGVNPKFNLAYQASPDQLWFVTAAKGYRAGGPNNPAPEAVCGNEVRSLNLSTDALRKYSPDSVWNYELGTKTSWWQNRLIINASVYQINWQDVQQQIVLQCGFNLTANFGQAKSRGFELELQYLPTANWLANLSLNHTQAKLENDVPGTAAKRGDRLLDVPAWNLALGLEYRGWRWFDKPAFARLDFNYTGAANFLYDRSSPFYQRSAYKLTRLSIGTRPTGKAGWGAGLFIDNLFNQHGATALPVAISADLSDTRRLAVLRPRTIGLNWRWYY